MMPMRINWFDMESSRLPLLQLDDDLEQKILSPLSCIREHESKWVIEFDLPLVEKKDISVSLDPDGILVVEAKLKEAYEDSKGDEQYHFEYFRKSLTLPKNADTKKISARFSSGRLEITLPKLFGGTPVKIE